jgi:AcrR family transcriptional regulator
VDGHLSARPLSPDAIIGAARRILATDGLDALSLRRLGAMLGVTAPALYAHFSDKEDLLATVAAQGYEELLGEFETVEADDPVDRLVIYARRYVAKAVREPALFEVMSAFPPGSAEPTLPGEMSAADEAVALPMGAIEEAIAAARFHPDRDPFLTSMTMWTATHGLAKVLNFAQRGESTTILELADSLIDDVLAVCMAGLASPPVGS